MADITVAEQITVPAKDSVDLEFRARAAQSGAHPFTITASGPGADSASAMLVATGNWNVNLALTPDPAVTGPGATAMMDLTVTNLGNTQDSYDLALELPDGWTYTLDANGAETSTVTVPPQLFNSAHLDLALTPPPDATPGEYVITATATSQAQPDLVASASSTVELLVRGVQVEIEPASSTLAPTASATWQVTVTNTGSVASSYWLTATGIVGPSGEFATNPVALDPGQSTTVAFSAGPFDFALPTTYPFSIAATAQEDDRIHAEDTATITFETYEAVEVVWQPPTQTVVDSLSATFLLVITNTSNVPATYQLTLDTLNLRGELPLDSITLPAKSMVQLPVTVEANGPGTYTFEGAATAAQASGDDTATLTIEYTSEPPSAEAGHDQTVNEGDEVTFSGSGSDPDGGTVSVHWDFGDGETAGDTFSPSHTYADDGNYLVTLTVTDESGLSTTDTLWVRVQNVAPDVDAGPEQTVEGGDVVQFNGSFSDPGILDTHSIEWQFGDAGNATGTLTPSFIFGEPGTYEVTLTVTDDDGGVGSDTLTVVVESTGYVIRLPIVFRE
jgi:PKD repeat protein